MWTSTPDGRFQPLLFEPINDNIMGEWSSEANGLYEKRKTKEEYFGRIDELKSWNTNSLSEQKKNSAAREWKELEFVNYTTATVPNKHGTEVQKFIKSHAMLNYRQKQRKEDRGYFTREKKDTLRLFVSDFVDGSKNAELHP